MRIEVRRRWLAGFVVAALAAGLASCARPTHVPASPDPTELAQRSADKQRRQADDALRRWAEAVDRGGPDGFALIAPVRAGTRGTWEEAVGGNNKGAVLAGLVEVGAALPSAKPMPALVRWPDGSTLDLQPLSAAQTAALIRTDGSGDCAGCQPLIITGATPTTDKIQTTRGPASVPAWEFTLYGTAVRLVRPAIDGRNVVQLEQAPWDSANPPEGLTIDSAQVGADERTLTVSFIGARGPASQKCGADYAAEAVESELAVVIMIFTTRHPYVAPAPGELEYTCPMMGFTRTATATLDQPLGSRAVLEVTSGLPVPIS